jgi:hypothetical protein
MIEIPACSGMTVLPDLIRIKAARHAMGFPLSQERRLLRRFFL